MQTRRTERNRFIAILIPNNYSKCNNEYFFCTGEGWLTLIIDYVAAKHKSGSKTQCDPWYKSNTGCDAYVKVLFNDHQAFKSSTKNGEESNYWYYELFQSNKISKNANMKFELWDADDGYNDDLILRATTEPELLSTGKNSYYDGDNVLSVIAHWRKAYEDD